MFLVCQLGFEFVQFREPARSKVVEEQIFARNSRWVPLFFIVLNNENRSEPDRTADQTPVEFCSRPISGFSEWRHMQPLRTRDL